MTYSKHELSTISMFYSRKKKKKIVILLSSFPQQPPFYKGPKVAVVERFGCIFKSSILLKFIHFQLCISNKKLTLLVISSDISKLLYVISRAVRRVKFATILKYHEWYSCQISSTNRAIICLYYYPEKVCNFHM